MKPALRTVVFDAGEWLGVVVQAVQPFDARVQEAIVKVVVLEAPHVHLKAHGRQGGGAGRNQVCVA